MTTKLLTLDDPAEGEKAAAALAAANLVEDGMTVGLGTGSTASLFVSALAARRLKIRCVSTSKATAVLAVGLRLEVVDLDAAGRIDLTVDGADEVGPGLALIKGAGGALLREKLVWEASDRCVVIADSSKHVTRLGAGAYPVPVEVTPFGHGTTAARIATRLASLGLTASGAWRMAGTDPFQTDGGNLIYDLQVGAIADPAALADALKGLTGVVDHGLFIGLAERALIAGPNGVETFLA
jgi:ribose 5-phosphate isomerase A